MAAQKVKFKKLHLNLLFPQGSSLGIYFKFIKWLLSYGRFIVIFVEVIVIGAFVARFKLDSDLADLKQSINRQIPVIESLSEQEILIKQTQFRLTSAKKIINEEPSWGTLYNKIASQIPSGVILKSLSIDKNPSDGNFSFRLTGEAFSNNDLALLIVGLRKDPNFKDVSLTSLNLDQGVLLFSVSGAVKIK